MPLLRTQRALVEAQAEIIRLIAEIHRLEHALTSANILAKVLIPPEQVVLNLAKDLTPREEEILIRIMAGDSTRDIAARLYMSRSTVKVHIQHLYKKIGVHNRGGAAVAGVRLGLDQPDEEQS